LQHVISCTTSNAIWTKLKLIHEQDASESIHALQQKFYRCTLGENESLASFMSNIEVIVSQLASGGDTTFTDKAIIAKIMSSLPAGYDSLLLAWDSTPDASKTLETLTLRLYQQETRIKNRAAVASSEKVSAYVSAPSNKSASGKDTKGGSKGGAADSRSNVTYEQRQARRKEIDDKKDTEYWKCGSKGHWSRECPNGERKDDSKGKNRQEDDDPGKGKPGNSYKAFVAVFPHSCDHGHVSQGPINVNMSKTVDVLGLHS
jgi:hypothetical protein